MNNEPMEMWRKVWEEQVERTEAAWKQAGTLETKGIEQARAAVDEWAELTRESIAYGSSMHAQWRALGMDAMKKMIAFGTPR